MIIIWSRWGILVLLFAGAGALIGFALKAIVLGPSGDSATSGMFVGIGLMLAAVGLYFFDREVVRKHLDKPRLVMVTQQFNPPLTNPDGTLTYSRQVPAVHPQTGQPIAQQPTSSLFFIPVRFWPYVLAAIGLVVLVSNLITLSTR